ncbi:MAG: ATP-binding protein [Methanoregula sp.]|nr:ATP-binding protein [Methanoregula sp.]
MNNEYLIRLIHEYNPQLAGRPIEVAEFRRDLYREIEPWIAKKQAIAIVGLRRTGKTTLMRQLMSGMEPGTLFFSFDEEETQKKEVLVFVIDYAINVVHATSIFLDEIHYVEDWEGVLKRYYDQKHCKFILSGSESLEISKAKATLAGRLVTFQLDILSFPEYLRLKGAAVPEAPDAVWDFVALERQYNTCLVQKEYYEHEFLEYLYKGAFPELVREDDSTVIRRYIADLVVRKIIYRDIPAIFDIRRRDLLYDLFRFACSTTSGLFDIQNLSRTLNASHETVTSYLFFIRTAFLIRVAEPYSRSPAKRMRRHKKVYVAHPSIACAVLGYDRTQLIEPVLGPYVETLFAGKFFWRDKEKNEVDVVVESPTLIPIEIKYQNRISPADTKSLRLFMKMHKVGKAVLITKNIFLRRSLDGNEILLIPAWFALLCHSWQSPATY